jgi:serine/threonine protein kinase
MSEVNDDGAGLPAADSAAERAEQATLAFRSRSAPAVPAGVPPELANHPRYRVVELLGEGGMGAVYRAEHRVMKRAVAIKVINGRLLDSPSAIERFRREVEAAARLSHPNIVTVHDADRAGESHFLVMELVDGITLARLVERKGRLPVAHACEYIRQAALGLQHAHEHGMVHRDIKPENLMLTRKGQIKVLDFGLARLASENSPARPLTEVGVVAGTPDYIAPEQAEDTHQADIRADIYSLGCTLYFLLSGQPPFPRGSILQKLLAHHMRAPRPLDEFRDDLPPGLAEVFERMTAKDPAQRFQTPIEAARALLAVRQESSTREANRQAIQQAAPPASVEKGETAADETGSLPSLRPVRSPAEESGTTVSDGGFRGRPRTRKMRTSGHRPRTVVAVLCLVLGFLLLAGAVGLIALAASRPRPDADRQAGTVLRSADEQAEVFFQSAVPDAEVVVRRDGQVIESFRPGPGRRLSLPPGEYDFQLAWPIPGHRLSANRLVLAAGDRKSVDLQPDGAPTGPNGPFPPPPGLPLRPGFPPPPP